ncbi:cyclophilin-like fold protein [Candidatus Nitrosocosmicus arcticus]|uniref:Cyclophilin TM1367-like domain-containing protein n=1 Tax=Candidatus Nitrosocosmicus arcticus TaxID=2035267 RepID=A0A557STF2_9ARCH|nr:cyclophilin-like family protein [Candidatus Nitrosocosmicus arcticus]TVP39882.1 hypothetical protein NARC_110094 [Candidatus Nitrosocosmicus arcticus]
MSSESQSVSRIPIKIELNRARELQGEFRRHLSPLTVKKLINVFPLVGRINSYDGKFIYIQLDVELGSEKPVNSFKKGEIAFSPLGNFLCIFLCDATLDQKMNLLGRVTSDNIDILQSFKVGDHLSIDTSPN